MQDYLIPSDVLTTFGELYRDGNPFAMFCSVFRVDLILDANVVISELRWFTTRRIKPNARSTLLNVLEAGTLSAWAPAYIEHDVLKQVPTIVNQGAKEEEILAHWVRLKAHINFVDVGGVPERMGNHIDVQDVPYLRLQRRIEARIIIDDRDIHSTGGKAVPPFKILGALRAYSRTSAVHLTLQVNGHKLGALGFAALAELLKAAAPKLKQPAGSIPKSSWVSLLTLAVVAAAVPTVENWLRSQASRAIESLATPWGEVFDVTQALSGLYARISAESDSAPSATQQHVDDLEKGKRDSKR